jgi:UDP-2,4-diacetamido-2,4,6-trideoxy-beta-L-altropyranose hydrolase
MIVIRADGGKTIGMGHLMRTSVLAQELKKYTDVCYVCSNEYAEGIHFLRDKGFKVLETDNVLETLMQSKAKAIITDHYSISSTYINEVRAHFKVVGYIDDNVAYSYKADFILNQNFGAEQLNYENSKPCDLLVGIDYLLIREEFRNLEPIKIKEKVEKVLITVGGSDYFNLTEKILEIVCDLPFHFYVVIGPAFPYQNKLYNRYNEYENIHFEVEPTMSKVAQKCDMAISSCGSTLYELALVGIPTIGINIADNQVALAKRMEEACMIWSLGDIKSLLSEQINEALMKLAYNKKERLSLQQANRSRVNGNGAKKVAEYIMGKVRNEGSGFSNYES